MKMIIASFSSLPYSALLDTSNASLSIGRLPETDGRFLRSYGRRRCAGAGLRLGGVGRRLTIFHSFNFNEM